MAIKISGTTVIDNSRNLTNITDGSFTGTGYLGLPAGTTAQRPGSPSAGMIRYNTTLGETELYDGTAWSALGGSLISFNGTVQSSYTFNEGASVSESLDATSAFTGTSGITYSVISGTLPSGLSYNSSTGALTGTAPDLVSTTNYTVTLQANDNINTATKAITFTINADNDAPTWSTAADLGVAVSGAYSRQLTAVDPEGQTLTYSLASGSSLPPNTTLSSSGLLSGTASTTGTTYTFTVNATDGTNTVSRTFSLIYGYIQVGSDGSSYQGGTIISNGTGVLYYNNTTSLAQKFFTAPAGVSSLNIVAIGSGGGAGEFSSNSNVGGGGGGGVAIGTYSISPEASYTIYLGGKANSNNSGGATSVGPLISAGGGIRGNGNNNPSTSLSAGGTGSGGNHVNATGGVGGTVSNYRDDNLNRDAGDGGTGGGGRAGGAGGDALNSYGGGGGGGASPSYANLGNQPGGAGGSGGPNGYSGGSGGQGYASSGQNGGGPAGGNGSGGSCDPRGCQHATTNQGAGGGGSFGGGGASGAGWFANGGQSAGGAVVINWGYGQVTS